MNKDWRKLAQEAELQGWRVIFTSKHIKWYPPNRRGMVVSSNSPSDKRAYKNHLSLLRKYGFNG